LGTAGGAGDGAGGGDAVFFTLAPGVLIRYTQAWALPLAVLAALLFAGLAVFGWHRRALRPGGLLLGVAGFLGSVAAVVVVATLAWLALQRLAPSYRAPATALTGATYHPFPLLLGFVALAAATMAGLYAWLGARLRPAEALAGALCGWLAAALLTARALPGASYLFVFNDNWNYRRRQLELPVEPGTVGPVQHGVLREGGRHETRPGGPLYVARTHQGSDPSAGRGPCRDECAHGPLV
jgi:hypothetical protein